MQKQVQILGGGVNQSGVRAHNERLILSVLQRNGAMPGSDIARLTGLSPQTVSVILRKLETDALILRRDPVKGRVGKPSVPMDLNPDGLFSVGLKIGRRSADLVLLDFVGQVRDRLRITYAYPMPDTVFGFLDKGLRQVTDTLPAVLQARICGIGVAAPHELWNWQEIVGAPARDIQVWRTVDMAEAVAQVSDLPVYVVNDATAACRAEHIHGGGRAYRDYVYVFVGAIVGGGVVLDHSVYEGHQGNAGALGPLPSFASDGRETRLIDTASIHGLEQRLQAAGLDRALLWTDPQDWSALEDHVDPWIDQVGLALAKAALAVCAVIDFEAVVIDGAMPEAIRARLVDRVQQHLQQQDQRGLVVPQIAAGSLGAISRAIGAASGPVLSQVLFDKYAGAF